MSSMVTTHPELRGYHAAPMAMHVGAPGKRGVLRLEFRPDAKGKSRLTRLYRRTPIIVQQELYFDKEMPELPCVYILASGGPYVEGDRLQQEILLREGAMAHISTGAATKIAEMSSNFAAMQQSLRLERDSYLEYLPEPVYPSAHSRYVSDTEILIHPSATLVYGEIYTCGRRHYRDKLPEGEHFCYDLLSVGCRVRSLTDSDTYPLLLHDKFLVRPSVLSPRSEGIMADFEVFATLLILTPAEHRVALYDAITPCYGADTAVSVTTLPNGAGLLLRILGHHTADVKNITRHYASLARQELKGHPLPPEFPWR